MALKGAKPRTEIEIDTNHLSFVQINNSAE